MAGPAGPPTTALRTTNAQQLEQLEHYGRRTCNELHASTVVGVVIKLDPRRVLLTTRSTCRGDIF